ncbi:MAG: acyl transferase [Saprospirales bacterium]|nr:MAG: acyl transferase [Saprospirales bacterium]
MDSVENLRRRILNLVDRPGDFEEIAMRVFEYQFANNELYRRYCEVLGFESTDLFDIYEIPCLPIEFFKSHEVKTGSWNEEKTFLSSGTGGQIRAKHHLRDRSWYKKISTACFEAVYGPVEHYNWIGLLPNYLEQGQSSLVHMVSEFAADSNKACSGIFGELDGDFFRTLDCAVQSDRKTILIGVSFALLDLAEKSDVMLVEKIIPLETGGMKGRREEMIRSDLHRVLKEGLRVDAIHSEYGMTELFSQAYAKDEGIFEAGPTMRIYSREVNDPFCREKRGVTGGVNVIDLANLDTCSFIMTMDLGRMVDERRFEIMGRLDGSEMRGCNLMYGDR